MDGDVEGICYRLFFFCQVGLRKTQTVRIVCVQTEIQTQDFKNISKLCSCCEIFMGTLDSSFKQLQTKALLCEAYCSSALWYGIGIIMNSFSNTQNYFLTSI
jgi:hypothetical protein